MGCAANESTCLRCGTRRPEHGCSLGEHRRLAGSRDVSSRGRPSGEGPPRTGAAWPPRGSRRKKKPPPRGARYNPSSQIGLGHTCARSPVIRGDAPRQGPPDEMSPQPVVDGARLLPAVPMPGAVVDAAPMARPVPRRCPRHCLRHCRRSRRLRRRPQSRCLNRCSATAPVFLLPSLRQARSRPQARAPELGPGSVAAGLERAVVSLGRRPLLRPGSGWRSTRDLWAQVGGVSRLADRRLPDRPARAAVELGDSPRGRDARGPGAIQRRHSRGLRPRRPGRRR